MANRWSAFWGQLLGIEPSDEYGDDPGDARISIGPDTATRHHIWT